MVLNSFTCTLNIGLEKLSIVIFMDKHDLKLLLKNLESLYIYWGGMLRCQNSLRQQFDSYRLTFAQDFGHHYMHGIDVIVITWTMIIISYAM